MDLKEIISISGRPGLYKVVARSAKNFIVESIDDHKTRISVNASQQVAVLDEITVYTNAEDNLPLKTVFENMEKKRTEGTIPSPKDNPVDIREFFKFAAPGYDQDRVYISDMKKMLKWFDIIYPVQEETTEASKETASTPKPVKKPKS